jgi:hypothetical protein
MQCEKPLVRVKAESKLQSLMHALSTRRAVEDSERKYYIAQALAS